MTDDEQKSTSKRAAGVEPKYWPSRTPEEWRTYHREYYRANLERRRQQARESYLRCYLRKIFGGRIPSSLRRGFLRR